MNINLKYYSQHTDYSCGPVCLRMIFEHLGKSYSEEKLIQLCYASEKTWTSHSRIISVIKGEGFTYYSKIKGTISDIIKMLENGYPAMVNYLDSFNEGHYAVVTGYDKKKKVIILSDPYDGKNFIIKWNDFQKRWYNQKRNSRGWFVVVGRELIKIK